MSSTLTSVSPILNKPFVSFTGFISDCVAVRPCVCCKKLDAVVPIFVICSGVISIAGIGSPASIGGISIGFSKASLIGKSPCVIFSVAAFCASVISLAVAFCVSVTGLNNLVNPV